MFCYIRLTWSAARPEISLEYINEIEYANDIILNKLVPLKSQLNINQCFQIVWEINS